MSPKLKFALICRYSDRGFALPIAISLGFIILLVVATLLMRSQGDQMTATAQKATARNLSSTETGITRVQSLLNTWRVLPNITLANIGASSSSWQGVFTASPSNSCLPPGASNPTSGYRLNEWITLENGDKFKITEYTYKPDSYTLSDGSSGPRDTAQIDGSFTIPASNSSTVTVTVNSPANYVVSGSSVSGHIQGIQGTLSNDAGAYKFKRRYTAGADTTISSAETFYPDNIPGVATLKLEGKVDIDSTANNAIEVSIPVTQTTPSSIAFPGLWVKGGAIPSNNEIKGNLLVSGCSANIGGTIAGGQRFANPNIVFPDLPTRPTSNFNDLTNKTIPVGETNSNKMYVENGVVTAKEGSITFPSSIVGETSVIEDGVEVYKYRMNAINLARDIVITPGKKVIFYVEGNIDTGSKEITHNYSTKPTNFQIFGYGTSIGDPLQPHFCMHGSGATYGFLFAPDYNVGIAGAGGNAGFVGSVWARQWNPHPGGISSCGSNTGNTVVTQTADWTDLGSALAPKNIPPKTAPITAWTRQEVTP